MELVIEGIAYAVPVDVETAGPAALRAWIVAHLPPAHAALALGEPVPAATPDDDEA